MITPLSIVWLSASPSLKPNGLKKILHNVIGGVDAFSPPASVRDCCECGGILPQTAREIQMNHLQGNKSGFCMEDGITTQQTPDVFFGVFMYS